MNRIRRAIATAAVTGVLISVGATTAPARADDDQAYRPGPTCDFGAVVFDGDYEGGRLNGCIETGANAFALVTGPEDTPINPSAWYAFRVDSEDGGTLDLTIRYRQGRHRYAPKLSHDGEAWSELEAFRVAEDESAVSFTIDLDDGPIWIAGQPLAVSANVEAWLANYADRRDLVIETLGESEEGRPIRALRTRVTRRQVLFIVGRQHPPETTGSVALEAFVDRVLTDEPLANRFRRRFSVHVIPVLNPDGVARGHWRHNSRGLDLNRDWGPFTQAESRLAAAALDDATRENPERLALFLDFHSTWNDVFYTQPDGVPGRRMDFPAAWIAAVDARVEGGGPPRNATHNPGLPTAKNWVYETYRAPAITFELGDATPIPRIEAIAEAAAEEAMRLLLED
ncbi:MAG: M14 family metallopeptidase [Maricaulaceae bacterium]